MLVTAGANIELNNEGAVRATDQAIQTVTRPTLAGVTRDNMKMRAHYKARALQHRPNESLITYQYKSLLGLRLQKKSSLFSPRG